MAVNINHQDNQVNNFTITQVGSGATVGSAGIVTYHGDGSALTGIEAGFSPDAQKNLYAGTSAGANSDSDTCLNIALGCNAANQLNSGDNNIFLGTFSGQKTTSGCYNIFFGHVTGKCNNGKYNIAIGECAGRGGSSTVTDNTGEANIFIGKKSGCSVTTGEDNVFLGRYAGMCVDTGSDNIAIGMAAATELTTGQRNVFIGFCAGQKATDCNNNFFGGYQAGRCNDGGDNIFLGRETGKGSSTVSNNTGSHNIFSGYQAGLDLTSGGCNIGLGVRSLTNITTGSYNVVFGMCAGHDSSDGMRNVFLGCYAGGNATSADDSIFIGSCAGGGGTVTGNSNIFIGKEAGSCNSSGASSVIIGEEAGAKKTTGDRNIFLGKNAGKGNSDFTSTDNIFIGCGSGMLVSTATGPHNIGIGEATFRSLQSTGKGNVAVGRESGEDVTTGCYNFFGGYGAGKNVNSGSCNVFLGFCAGNTNTSGSKNIAIGRDVELPSATGDNQLAIGDGTSRWITGDSSYNVCLAGSTIKAMASGGVFCATCFVGVAACIGAASVDSNYNGDLPVVYLVNNNRPRYDNTPGEEFVYNPSTGTLNAKCFVGCGAGLTGLPGFSPDAEGNLYAGTGAGAASDGDTLNNVSLGCNAGNALNAGDYNVFLGYETGKYTNSGSNNIFFGCQTGMCNTSADNNIFFGNKAGYCTSDESCNVAIGFYAAACRNSSKGIFIGRYAGYGGCNGAAGANNIALGNEAGKCLTSGFDNVFMGRSIASVNQVTGKYNIVFGCGAGMCLKGGTSNVLIGKNAGSYGVTDCSFNIFLGMSAGYCNNGEGNIFLGSGAGKGSSTIADNTGGCNIGIGRFTGECLTTGINNIFLGKNTGSSVSSGNNNVFIGSFSGECSITDAAFGVHIGSKTGRYVCGGCNIFLGMYAGHGVNVNNGSTGTQNIFIGKYAGNLLTSGTDNILLGSFSGGGAQLTGSRNIILGRKAGCDTTSGSDNIIIGCLAGCSLTSAQENIFIGNKAGRDTSTAGQKNLFLGDFAGYTNTTGCCNIAIGREVTLPSATGNHQFAIGDGTNRWITGDSNFNIYDKDGNQLNGGGGATDKIEEGNTSAEVVDTGSDGHFKVLTEGTERFRIGPAGIATFNNDLRVTGNLYLDSTKYLSAGGSGNNWGSVQINGSGGAGYEGYSIDGRAAFVHDGSTTLGLFDDVNDHWVLQHSMQAIDSFTTLYSGNNTERLRIGPNGQLGLSGANYGTSGQVLTSGGASGAVSWTTVSSAGFSPDADENLVAGTDAGASLDGSSGCYNVFLGLKAGNSATSGAGNVYIGCCAGESDATGIRNVAIGPGAACDFTAGNQNVFLGYGVANGNTGTIGCNVIIGDTAGCNQKQYSTIIGAKAGGENTGTNCGSTFLGHRAGYYNSGDCNVAIGVDAGRRTTGDYSIAIGYYAGECVKAAHNISMGYCALRGGTGGVTGSYNIAIGRCAGSNNTSGTGNVAIGKDIQLPSATDNCQFAIGNGTDRWITGDSNFNIYDKDGNQLNGGGGGGSGVSQAKATAIAMIFG